MPTLLLQLRGPMQAWGTRSRFDYRDTWPYPTKSGAVGLLAAALGRDRKENISDLAALRMGVRVDRKGVLKVDYQTAQFVYRAGGYVYVGTHKEKEWLGRLTQTPIRVDSKQKQVTITSKRYFLSDAAFLVGLEGDGELLRQLHLALQNPRFPLYLGRKSYVPSPPPYLPDGLVEAPLEEALQTYPYLLTQEPQEDLLLVLESSQGRLVYDQPLGTFAQRRYGARYLEEQVLPKDKVGRRQDVPQQTGT